MPNRPRRLLYVQTVSCCKRRDKSWAMHTFPFDVVSLAESRHVVLQSTTDLAISGIVLLCELDHAAVITVNNLPSNVWVTLKFRRVVFNYLT